MEDLTKKARDILDHAIDYDDGEAGKRAVALLKQPEDRLGKVLYDALMNNELSLWHQIAQLASSKLDNERPMGRFVEQEKVLSHSSERRRGDEETRSKGEINEETRSKARGKSRERDEETRSKARGKSRERVEVTSEPRGKSRERVEVTSKTPGKGREKDVESNEGRGKRRVSRQEDSEEKQRKAAERKRRLQEKYKK